VTCLLSLFGVTLSCLILARKGRPNLQSVSIHWRCRKNLVRPQSKGNAIKFPQVGKGHDKSRRGSWFSLAELAGRRFASVDCSMGMRFFAEWKVKPEFFWL
jgi:hypothetical protein